MLSVVVVYIILAVLLCVGFVNYARNIAHIPDSVRLIDAASTESSSMPDVSHAPTSDTVGCELDTVLVSTPPSGGESLDRVWDSVVVRSRRKRVHRKLRYVEQQSAEAAAVHVSVSEQVANMNKVRVTNPDITGYLNAMAILTEELASNTAKADPYIRYYDVARKEITEELSDKLCDSDDIL